MKKVLIFILIFLVALCPLYVLPTAAADELIIEDGILISYTGNDSVVTIPDNVYYIADGAFKDNVSLSKLNLHNDLQIIGNEAFYGCTSLKEIIGGKNVSYVGAYAFYNTPFLSLNNDEVVTIGSVLLGANVQGDFVLDEDIVMIAPYAFADNTDLRSFKATDNLSTIGEGAFYRCSSLKKVELGQYISSVGALAFFETAFVSESKEDFVTIGDGVLIQYNGSSNSVAIPESVRYICGGAFYSNTNITDVKFSEGVYSIGKRAFANCSNLNSVDLPQSLVMIDDEAFARCKKLESIIVPKNVELMGESVFYACNSLESAEFKNPADIATGTFVNCTSLSFVNLSGAISSIGDSAFLNCSSLTDLSVTDNVNSIGEDAFKGCDNLTIFCNQSSFVYEYSLENGINALQCGDANLDGKVNIRDATYIQKYVATMVEMSSVELLRAETNFDGKINIRDATYIQKLLAGMV